ncbi:S1/P1 nuclease [Nocardia sp. CDC159]|uniref:S1/P1 nuclease n=1 Tax=Nocardia pulmonis TaxID=2951408 RepID=A0A9X2E3I7_9NOCA|nr:MULTISPECIES: S1/P1 nuclease [Nocardia]MCM6772155.1 S1/P1 nuclease [Nocardia pulmonis]MCM6785187.1 S1/P1 nuclease [Nocardia sp. CDC159]
MRCKAVVAGALAVAATLLAAPSAHAWGEQGHDVTGAIADLRLTPAARDEVGRLLAGEPDPTLAGVATWADDIRKSDPVLGKRSAPWHYVNIAENGCAYDPAVNGNDGQNVIEALRAQTKILADRGRSVTDRNQALKFIVHFVGDIHQPLHAGYARDRGGNEFKVQYNGQNTNLHSVWDSRLLDTRHASDEEETKRVLALPAPELSPAQPDSDPIRWAEDSCRVAVSPGFYPEQNKIGEEYTRRFLPVAESRLRLAGERLGQLLNAVLDPAAR